jgi:protein O-GlcNAc transferase
VNREQVIAESVTALSSGGAAAAANRLRVYLSTNEQDADARYHYARSLAALGRLEEAAGEFRRLLAIRQQSPELHFSLGLCHLGLGGLPAAEACFRRAIALDPRIPEAHDNLGATLFRQRRYPEAAESFQQAVALNPTFVSAKTNLGDALMRAGNPAGAIDAYRDAAALQPDDALVHACLGTALLVGNDLPGAAECLERALILDGGLADVALNLGTALLRLNQYERAASAYGHALAVRPDHAEAALKLAEVLDKLGRRSQALEVYERAVKSISGNPDIHDAHGRLLHRLGRHHDALACYARALEIDPGRRGAQLNRGNALESLGSIEEAALCFQRVIESNPEDRDAIAGAASCAFRICDWNLAKTMTARLSEFPAGVDSLNPFLQFAAGLESAVIAESCRRTARAVAERSHESSLEPYAHARLRVAYLSPDFRQHPVAYAIAGVLARQDRTRIESIGISLVAADNSDIAARLKASVDEFIDCGAMTDDEIVKLLRRREIDIAIDLAGFTSGARPAVFAARVAPVQVNFLGFAGSTGASYMDCMIADEVVVPYPDEPLYAEKIVRLPGTYLPFDCERKVGSRPDNRVLAGLPGAGFVFCGFSNGYKITREVFEVWVTLLQELPGSVLWLRGGNRAMERNLVRAAGDSGVAADRLVFAPFVAQADEHLTRLQLADLFLDTAPYNAHTTAAEALWAGVPVITCRGRAFAGRVGASVLTAAGLPELISEDLNAYRELALNIARSPQAQSELRQKMASTRAAALFDTGQYVRDFESALYTLWRRPA